MRLSPKNLNRHLSPSLFFTYHSAATCFQSISFNKEKQLQKDNDLKGKSILVIDNNLVNQIVMKMIIRKWNNTIVDFATNGKEGLKKLTEKHYDVILMDLQMPVMDGYETTLAIRRAKIYAEYKNIPIIALTSDESESTKARVLGIGMNKHLVKPVDKEMLFEYVKSLV